MRGLNGLIPALRPFAFDLVNLASQNGLQPRITSVRRTYAQQARLYRKFLLGQSAYPAAPPGSSEHERGLAFDMVVSDMSYLEDLGQVWESWGGAWGGRYSDPIHFGVEARPEQPRSALRTAQSVAETAAGLLVPLPVSLLYTAEKKLAPGFVEWQKNLAKKVYPAWWVDAADRIVSLF